MDEEAQPPRFRLPFFRAGERGSASSRHGLRVRSDFEGGNAETVTVVSPSHLRFAARADTSPRPLWFYFCIQDARVPAVRCDLMNADQCLGPRSGWRTARPVFSSDGRNWQRVARTNYVEETATSGYFTFTAPVVGRSLYVAYCYPYTGADLEEFIRSLPRGAGVETGELCRSGEGRPVPYLRFGNHTLPQRSVWVIARQHAGETPASFTVQGLMEGLTLPGAERLACLSDTAFHVIPMLDVDGVYHGRYGKDQEPVDFNRDWRDAPARGEVAAVLKAVAASQERCRVSLALDLHAPHHGDRACYLFGYPEETGELFHRQARLLQYLAEEGPAAVGFRQTDFRSDYRPEHSARDFLWRRWHVPALTLEMSYHLAQSGEYLSPRIYREFGTALARALDRDLRSPTRFR